MECLRLISTSTWGLSRHVERIEPMTEDMEKDTECGAGELAIALEQRRSDRYTVLMKKTAIASSIFSITALAFMFVYLSTRSVVIKDTAQARESVAFEDKVALSDKAFAMTLKEEGDCIKLSLPEGTDSEDIVIENKVTTCQLLISIEEADDFYTGNTSVTTPGNVTGCLCVPQNDSSVSLEFQLDGIYEYTSTLDGGTLSVSFVNPHEIYDRIILIDPVMGDLQDGDDVESDASLYEALALKDRLEKEKVKAYLTRTDAGEIDLVDKRALIGELDPDLVICIDTGADTAVYYNDNIYLRGYGNDDFAGQVLADISYETYEVGHTDNIMAYSLSDRPYELMTYISVPSVLVTVPGAPAVSEGVLEASYDHTYQDQVATGLYKAVLYAYSDMNK
ncbi:hypothetical protein [Butyrivibrio fibrisolvens]|nr:hypothetical protein [Butyrivibrio fibrisolvens]